MDDKDLENYIIKNKIDAKIMYFEKHTMTVDSAVEQLKVSKDYIVKSILVINEKNQPFIILVNGARKVSFEKVAKVTGSSNIRMAKAKEVKEILGYEIGSVPPILYKDKIITIVDKRLLGYEYLIGGGGTKYTLLKIKPNDIIVCNGAKVLDVSE